MLFDLIFERMKIVMMAMEFLLPLVTVVLVVALCVSLGPIHPVEVPVVKYYRL